MTRQVATEVNDHTPLLLRRIVEIPNMLVSDAQSYNMTVVTTHGGVPEKHDQKDDKTSYRRDK